EALKLSTTGALDPSQIPACAQELEQKFGDLGPFSTTSAAKDLATFLYRYGNDFSTTVYGVGYGTVWVERVMYLDPSGSDGLCFMDSVLTTLGASPDKFANVTSSSVAVKEVQLGCAKLLKTMATAVEHEVG
ncbi:hypothetical protein F441_12093, partial [Phytophthora nicotianae CJ01A1]